MYLTLLQQIRHRLLSLRSKRSIAAGVRPSVFGVLGFGGIWGGPTSSEEYMVCDAMRYTMDLGGCGGQMVAGYD